MAYKVGALAAALGIAYRALRNAGLQHDADKAADTLIRINVLDLTDLELPK